MSENTEQVENLEPEGARDGAEDLGDAGKKALESERAARRETEKQLKTLQSQLEELQDAGKSDAEKLKRKLEREQSEREALQAELAARDRALLVREVADEVGLPTRLAARVQGEDRDAMLADARELMGLVAPEGPRKPAPVPEAGAVHGSTRSNADVFSEVMDRAFNQ